MGKVNEAERQRLDSQKMKAQNPDCNVQDGDDPPMPGNLSFKCAYSLELPENLQEAPYEEQEPYQQPEQRSQSVCNPCTTGRSTGQPVSYSSMYGNFAAQPQSARYRDFQSTPYGKVSPSRAGGQRTSAGPPTFQSLPQSSAARQSKSAGQPTFHSLLPRTPTGIRGASGASQPSQPVFQSLPTYQSNCPGASRQSRSGSRGSSQQSSGYQQYSSSQPESHSLSAGAASIDSALEDWQQARNNVILNCLNDLF